MDTNCRADLSSSPWIDYDYPRATITMRAGEWLSGLEWFRVEEVPLYPFSGSGEHAALVVEKREATTRDLALAVASTLNLDNAAVGYAGMKDKDAVAVQSFTVYRASEADAARAFEQAGAKVLSASRHVNKLRLGHLAGNRFRAFVRGGDATSAREAFDGLKAFGVPNFFGPQRFGAMGSNAREGLEMLRGRRKAGKWRRDLAVSALQSLVFNEILARRMEEGLLGKALTGDVMQKTDSGGLFVSEDPGVDQERLDRGEICPTGPLHGGKMKAPADEVAAREEAVLEALGLTLDLFRRETGARRALYFPLGFAGVEEAEGGIWLDFACPAGCYATSVIREVAASGVFRK